MNRIHILVLCKSYCCHNAYCDIFFSCSEPSPRSNVGGDERKALNEVKNVPLNKKSDKKNMPSSMRPNGTENLLVPRKRPKVSNKPHSSSSVSSSDEDVVLSNQRAFSRPGSSPGRTVPVHGSLKKPGFSFGSAKKVIVKKSITKFNPETKRKRKLLKPVNTAPSLGVKPWFTNLPGKLSKDQKLFWVSKQVSLGAWGILDSTHTNSTHLCRESDGIYDWFSTAAQAHAKRDISSLWQSQPNRARIFLLFGVNSMRVTLQVTFNLV